MNGKYTLRPAPVSIYDIGRYESWLGDQSARGLFFRSERKGRVRWLELERFEHGTPERRRYRLEPARNDAEQPPARERELYEEMGWRFVGALRNLFWVFEAPESETVPELHTDPAALGELYERVCRKLQAGRKAAVWIPVVLLMLVNVFLIPRDPLYTFLTGVSGYPAGLLLCVLLYGLVLFRRHVLPMRRLREQLARGEEIDHHAPYQRAARVYRAQTAAVLALFLLVFGSELYTIGAYRQEELFAAEAPPVPLLSELEGAGFQYDPTERFNGRPYPNFVRYEWSPLTPGQYTVNQSGQTGAERCSLQTAYYRVRFTTLAEPLFQSVLGELLRERYRFGFYEETTLRRLADGERAGFEEAALLRYEERETLIARRGRVVLRVDYDGTRELAELVPQIFAASAGAE